MCFFFVLAAILNELVQDCSPRVIINLRNVVAIELESSEEFIESKSWMTGNLRDTERRRRREKGCGDNNARYIVYWDHVDCVRYVWST